MVRLDQLLVAKQLASSRTLAQKFIADGAVEVLLEGTWTQVTRSSLKYSEATQLRITDSELSRYVSRGAFKLEGALSHYPIDLKGITALDVGQSTGGFTDYLLQHGVAKVVGLDVGRGQLAQKLRDDDRVYCFEGINARQIPEGFAHHCAPDGFDLIVMDVSFISQTFILPQLLKLLKPGATCMNLVKPQFELEKQDIGKGGIVRDAKLYTKVENRVCSSAQALGFKVCAYFESPITGSDGNREFFIAIVKP